MFSPFNFVMCRASKRIKLKKNRKNQSKIFKNAKDFEVLEKDKKIYILVQGKLYQIKM